MKKIYSLIAGLAFGIAVNGQVINTFPNTTDFEGQANCGTSCPGNCNPTTDWRNGDQYGYPQAGMDWLLEDGSTPSTATGPDVDHTLNSAVGKYFYCETSGCNNTTANCVSAIYDFSALSAPRMEFWYHMYGATMGVMHIDVDTSETNNWELDIVPAWTNNLNAWQMMDISLAAFAGDDSVRVRFRFVSGTSFESDAALDDIRVYMPLADDLKAVNAIAGGGCGNSACTPVSVDIINMGSNTQLVGTQIPVTLVSNAGTFNSTVTLAANLLPGDTISYSFGCVDLSGPSSVSYTVTINWAPDLGPTNNTSTGSSIGIPIISTYPYVQDFETGQNGWVINNNVNGTWAFGTPAKTTINSASSGVNSFVTGGLGTGFYMDSDNSWVEGPCFDFTNLCDPVISARIWWNAEFSWDGMNVVTSIDGGQTWQLQGTFGDQMMWYTDNSIVGAPGGYQEGWSGRTSTTNGSGGWVTARHHLAGVANQPNVKVRFAFGTDGSVTDDGVAFDDVIITDGVYLGADQLVCSPTTATLSADFGYPLSVTYAWSTGATTSTITASTTGWYWVDVTNGACVNRDSIYLVSVDANSDVMLGADTTVCDLVYTLDAGIWPGATFLWDDASAAQTRTITSNGVYSVTVTTPCGTMQDTISVNFNAATVNLGSDVTACDSATLDAGAGNTTYAWSNGGVAQMETVSSSGAYNVTVTNSFGCTDMDTINVTINASPSVGVTGNNMICAGDSTTLMASGADSYSWVNGPATTNYTVSPVLDSTYWVVGTVTATGCTDSAMFMVTVMQPSMMTQSLSVCYGDSIMVGSNTYNMSGMYMDTLTNAMGCDSIITTNLTVDTLIWASQSPTICAGDSYTVGANTYTASGMYSDTLAAMNGCDSIVTTNLSVTPSVSTSQSFTICNGQTITVGANTYGASGTYVDSLTSGAGCDSVVTTMLVVNTVNVGVTVTGNGATLSANNASATSYQWIDCSNMQPIAGATSSSYTATANGSYAVVVTDSACSDTSACTPVTNIGIDDPTVDYIFSVFPNPTLGNVTIATSKPTQVVIFNALGEVVLAQQVQNTITLDLTSLEGGVYFIRTTEGKVVRLVKE